MEAMARLYSMVREHGSWPEEWLTAHVTMIPKASGGTRPRDQRPITVLDVMYGVWAKGVVMSWSSTLLRDFWGSSAMRFRAESRAVHAVKLLSAFDATVASAAGCSLACEF